MAPLPHPQGRGRVVALPHSSPLAPAPSGCVPSSWSLASSQGSSPPTTSRWPGVWGVARMRRGRREASMIATVHVFKLHLRTHSRHHQAHPPPSMLVLFLRSRRRPFPPVPAAAFCVAPRGEQKTCYVRQIQIRKRLTMLRMSERRSNGPDIEQDSFWRQQA